MTGFLLVSHPLGDGTEAHVQDLTRHLLAEGARAFTARPHPPHSGHFLLTDHAGLVLSDIPPLSVHDDPAGLLAVLDDLGVTRVHIHHLLQFGLDAPGYFTALAQGWRVRVDMTLHDYLPVCPQVTLIDTRMSFCGLQDPPHCQDCVDRLGSFLDGPVDVAAWRAANVALMRSVTALIAPSHDLARRMQPFLAGRPIMVREHATRPDLARALAAPPCHRERVPGGRHVAVLGSLSMPKGARLLHGTAQAALAAGLDLRFTVIGVTVRDDLFAGLPNMTITGAYPPGEVLARIADAAPDLIWLPSVWPETFCYTLTEAVAAGVMPVVADLGAQADRLRSIGWGQIMPQAMMTDPEAAAAFLAGCEITAPPKGARAMLIRSFPGSAAYYAPDQAGRN